MADGGAGLGRLTSAGCVSMPHPVPTQQQSVAQANVAGVVVSVPRLDSGDFPGDILEVATAVLVTVENQSAFEITVDPSAFSLGAAAVPSTARFPPASSRTSPR